jgi:hypothetical protein
VRPEPHRLHISGLLFRPGRTSLIRKQSQKTSFVLRILATRAIVSCLEQFSSSLPVVRTKELYVGVLACLQRRRHTARICSRTICPDHRVIILISQSQSQSPSHYSRHSPEMPSRVLIGTSGLLCSSNAYAEIAFPRPRRTRGRKSWQALARHQKSTWTQPLTGQTNARSHEHQTPTTKPTVV